MSPALLSALAALALAVGLAAAVRALHRQADLTERLRASLTYEAIALYDADADEPRFEFVPAAFGRILGRLRPPETGERHWDYWRHFRESRPDWDAIIRRVLETGVSEARDGEVIVYPDGSRITIDWTVGRSHDAGRPWRRPRPCGFYITHRRSGRRPNPAVADRVAAMEARNAALEAELVEVRQRADLYGAHIDDEFEAELVRVQAECRDRVRDGGARTDGGPEPERRGR